MANHSLLKPVQLYDSETNCLYTVQMNESDAKRCQEDITFAHKVLDDAKSEEFMLLNDTTGTSLHRGQEDTAPCMIEGEENENNSSTWSYNETISLITAYENHKENFSVVKKRKFVWQNISNELLSNNFQKSALQCEVKWRNLVRTYKNIKDMKNSTGRGGSRFKFFEKIDDIIRDKPSTACSHTFSSLPSNDLSNINSQSDNIDNCSSLSGNIESHRNYDSNAILSVESQSQYSECGKKIKKRRTTDDSLRKKHEELLDIKISYFKKKEEKLEAREKRKEQNLKIKEQLAEMEQKRLNLLEKYLGSPSDK